ncbi:hypothetical protein BDK89_4178 [Ilumatobacter fluminis]|uniref:SCP domain-containing protein n=1 Tax=Ilumatobacter fluminis TaxID=467091 RepID=A0A4R7I5J6_9ACTN|nr:CAP domain-containing protein [Ilumatobacter fluminis]TDT18554.1 hypothetical protein BDK89_4178 [Ilumatobacter fluminis]
MPARRHLAAGIVALVAFAGVTVVSAGAVDEPARVGYRAWRIDPPGYIADPEQRARVAVRNEINAIRAEHGLDPLSLHSKVSKAAQMHADYLASIRKLDHLGPGATDTGYRLQQAGFSWWAWGENVGAGFGDPAVLVDTWFNSSAHRAQILGDYPYMGVGVGVTPDNVPYWVLVVAAAPPY